MQAVFGIKCDSHGGDEIPFCAVGAHDPKKTANIREHLNAPHETVGDEHPVGLVNGNALGSEQLPRAHPQVLISVIKWPSGSNC